MSPSRIHGVYTITCTVNGRQYVGSAADVRNRWSVHRSALNRGCHFAARLQADWNEHGASAFEFRVIAQIRERELREAAEQAYLDRIFGTDRAYNQRPRVSDNTGLKWTPEQREALSLAHKGLPVSDAHRAALSEAAKRRYAPTKGTPEMREQMAAMGRGNKGKPKSAQARANMAEARRSLTDDQIAEIRRRYTPGAKRGPGSRGTLAREFGVHPTTIRNVVNGRGYPFPAEAAPAT